MTTLTLQNSFDRHDAMFPVLGVLPGTVGSDGEKLPELPALAAMFKTLNHAAGDNSPDADERAQDAADAVYRMAVSLHEHERRTMKRLPDERTRIAYLDGLERRRAGVRDLQRLDISTDAAEALRPALEWVVAEREDGPSWSGHAAVADFSRAQDCLIAAIECRATGGDVTATFDAMGVRISNVLRTFAYAAGTLVTSASVALARGAGKKGEGSVGVLWHYFNVALMPALARAATHLRTRAGLAAEIERWVQAETGLLPASSDDAQRVMVLACELCQEYAPHTNPETGLLIAELESQRDRLQNALAVLAQGAAETPT